MRFNPSTHLFPGRRSSQKPRTYLRPFVPTLVQCQHAQRQSADQTITQLPTKKQVKSEPKTYEKQAKRLHKVHLANQTFLHSSPVVDDSCEEHIQSGRSLLQSHFVVGSFMQLLAELPIHLELSVIGAFLPSLPGPAIELESTASACDLGMPPHSSSTEIRYINPGACPPRTRLSTLAWLCLCFSTVGLDRHYIDGVEDARRSPGG
ncbi:hypothetical protein D9613_012441 [Agrocybe pediades]|uniref:Uncharacterized protein n=1 Tax=Agrocybe pediades TaxID=84607 RepID=A0A8H4QRE5_9AGAR|nr:hypothetical protein D9613_012441 [Agrocybe pediades]